VPDLVYTYEDVGLALIALPKGSRPPFPDQRQLDVPFFLKDSKGKGKVVFGAAVLSNTEGARAPDPDGYIYIYGLRGPEKELLVARVKEHELENFSQGRFWNGNAWVGDVHAAAPLPSPVSKAMSVSLLR